VLVATALTALSMLLVTISLIFDIPPEVVDAKKKCVSLVLISISTGSKAGRYTCNGRAILIALVVVM